MEVRVWWARGVSEYPAAPPFVVGDSVYSGEPAGLTWPPYDEPLRLFDKNKDRKIEFSEMSEDQVAWSRSLRGIDRNLGNRDNVLTEEEYKHGKRLRHEKLTEASGDYYASPVAGDDKIYLVSLKGKVTVLNAGRDWTILSTGDLG
ncbi:hypothetical protein L0244_00825, partial [bacterium]|nr:hypothetical protein [bacterium]